MPDQVRETEQAATRESIDGSRMSFDCCGTRMDDAVAGCRCASIMKRRPAATFAVCTLMGLALLVIPIGAILGIIAFLRTI